MEHVEKSLIFGLRVDAEVGRSRQRWRLKAGHDHESLGNLDFL